MKTEHHESLIKLSSEIKDWWKRETERTDSNKRCPQCWTRIPNCYCSYINKRKSDYKKLFPYNLKQEDLDNLGFNSSFNSDIEIEVLMYYHPLEIGRSANTAHIFEALCGHFAKPLVLGCKEDEDKLFDLIKEETKIPLKERKVHTCVLYPSKISQSLNQWLLDRDFNLDPGTNYSKQANEYSEINQEIKKIRFIALDGTYTTAGRMYKFLKAIRDSFFPSLFDLNTRQLCNEYHNAPNYGGLEFVQLDLSEEGCRSAVAGLMYQPALDKICTYQALVLAIQDVLKGDQYRLLKLYEEKEIGTNDEITGPSPLRIKYLLDDLDNWLFHIVKQKIKLGKSKTKQSLPHIDNSPDSFNKNIIEKIKNL